MGGVNFEGIVVPLPEPTDIKGGLGAQIEYVQISGGSVVPTPPAPPCICPQIIVVKGALHGGNSFSLLNTGISVLSLVDIFSGVILDATKWINVSSGGAVSVNNNLILSTPSTGGTSAIRSIGTWQNFDVSATYTTTQSVTQFSPSAEIIYFRMSARINSTNYFIVEHLWDPTRGDTLRTSITTAGSTSIISRDSVKSSARLLRLVRYNGRVKAYSGANLLVDYRGWRTDDVQIEMSNTCTSSPASISTTVSTFMPKVVVTFGDEICASAAEISTRIIGSTPAAILPGLVSVVAWGANSSQSLGNIFEYVAPLQLTVASSTNVSIVVNNDGVLRDTGPTVAGLRL